jgi:hypothetical protein
MEPPELQIITDKFSFGCTRTIFKSFQTRSAFHASPVSSMLLQQINLSQPFASLHFSWYLYGTFHKVYIESQETFTWVELFFTQEHTVSTQLKWLPLLENLHLKGARKKNKNLQRALEI